MSEEWKWIEGYEGLYQVSDHGRIKSFRKHKEGYVLSTKNQKGDYLRICLFNKDNERWSTSIHRLVAKTFVGHIPTGWDVHHIDGNRQNNSATNLAIIPPNEHYTETLQMGQRITKGMVHYNRFVRPREIKQLTDDGVCIATYPNAKEAGLATGICSRNILQVASKTAFGINGRTRKQAGGYVWKFASEGADA